jgi:SAM-dependent methyltransferase
VFTHRDDLPDAAAEAARYATHRNDPADPGYRAFLDRLAVPLVERLPPGAEGLDVGSGPGPTLSVMLAERGFPTEIWDPFFAPDETPLARTWDFVTCTETVEHFHDPEASWARLFDVVAPGGWLAVMTEPFDEVGEGEEAESALSAWWYARDPTHVALHRARTLDRVGARWGATEVVHPSRTVVLYRLPRG